MRKVFFSISNTCEAGRVMNGPGYQVEHLNDKQMMERENFQWNLPGETATATAICLQSSEWCFVWEEFCLMFVKGFMCLAM